MHADRRLCPPGPEAAVGRPATGSRSATDPTQIRTLLVGGDGQERLFAEAAAASVG